MNKQEFMVILKYHLHGIPEQDLKELLFDYEEHFEMGIRDGRDEEEIAVSLGTPKSIAKEIKANYMITKVEESFTVGNFFRAMFATLGLGFFNLVFILGPFIGIASALLAVLVSGIAITISGIAVFISIFLQPVFPELINNPLNPIVSAFVSIGLTSFGLLWIVGCYQLNKWFYLLAIKYFKLNLNIIVDRRGKND